MVTVRQVFEKAFGPIPEGATCHIGFYKGNFYESGWRAVIQDGWARSYWFSRQWERKGSGPYLEVQPTDISDRDGGPNGFLGFFGEDYDKAYWELVNG